MSGNPVQALSREGIACGRDQVVQLRHLNDMFSKRRQHFKDCLDRAVAIIMMTGQPQRVVPKMMADTGGITTPFIVGAIPPWLPAVRD